MPNRIKYFDARKEISVIQAVEEANAKPETRYVDFFLERETKRTKLDIPDRRHVRETDVVEVTERQLLKGAESYYKKWNGQRADLQFAHVPQVKILDHYAHLGYAAVTHGLIPGEDGKTTPWILYFANFVAQFGRGDALFEDINMAYGMTFFALALTLDSRNVVTGRDLRVRGNGVLFSTRDPDEAFANIVKLREAQRLWQATRPDRPGQTGTSPVPPVRRKIKTFAKLQDGEIL